MLSHNSINGIPAHMSHEIMTEIIRTAWNHSKVFFASDFNDIDDLVHFNVASTLQEARSTSTLSLAPHFLIQI